TSPRSWPTSGRSRPTRAASWRTRPSSTRSWRTRGRSAPTRRRSWPTRSGSSPGRAFDVGRYRVSRSARIGAAPARVYAVIADYREHHRKIVPLEYFPRLEVIEGGVGAGTRTRVEMSVLGQSRVFEQLVSEPEPGRRLRESNLDGSGVTTFTVDQEDGGASAHVTIATELVARPGVSGLLERLFTSVMLPRIYRKELAQLAAYVASWKSSP